MRRATRIAVAGACVTAAAVALAPSPEADAADHNDPVRVQASGPRLPGGVVEVKNGDPQGDLADMFAWHTEDDLVVILTWRTDPADAELDADVVYGIHIDNDRDLSPSDPADIDIWIRYAQARDGSGEWGQQVEGLPGVAGKVVSAVGEESTVDGMRMVTGLFDDPFVFDLDGFFNGLSVALGNAAPADPSPLADRPFGFDNRNDTFAGTNVGAFVLQIPLDKVRDHGDELHLWGTSRALPGRRDPSVD